MGLGPFSASCTGGPLILDVSRQMARLSAELHESRAEISMGATAVENAHEHVRILGTQLAELRYWLLLIGPFFFALPPLLDSLWLLA